MEGNVTNTVTSGVSTITSLVSDVWTMMVNNPLILAFVGAALLGAAIGVIRKLTKGRV